MALTIGDLGHHTELPSTVRDLYYGTISGTVTNGATIKAEIGNTELSDTPPVGKQWKTTISVMVEESDA